MKRQHHKGLRVRCCEDPLGSSEPESLKSKAESYPLQSHLRHSEARFPYHYRNSKKKTLTSGPLMGPRLEDKEAVISNQRGGLEDEEEGDTRGRDQ